MTPRAKEAMEVVDQRRVELVAAAKNAQIRVKINNLHEVCRILVVDAAQRLTIPEVIRRYQARFPAKEQSIAEQSLRNKRGGANPYIILYRAWEDGAEFILAPARSLRSQPGPSELLSTDDVAGIADTVLRHQVGLVIAQNRSLKSQLDILKNVHAAPVVRIAGPVGAQVTLGTLANHLALTETEVEALQDFLDLRRLRTRGLKRVDDGSIETMDGRRMSDPGFTDGLEKIVRSYER